MATFQKFGDWDIVMNICRNMPADIKASNHQTLLVMAAKAEGLAKKHINAQDLNWQALDSDYLAWKIQNGYSSKTLFQKGDYYNAITHFMSNKANVSHAGVTKQARNSEGIPIYLYGKVMEFGSIARNIPARPLWGPVLKEVHDFASDNQIFSKAVLKAFTKRGGK